MKHQRQPPPYAQYPPPGSRQTYPYTGNPYYPPQFGAPAVQYMDRYASYQYQRPPPGEYARYPDQPYGQVPHGVQHPPAYPALQTQHLPPKLKAAAKPIPQPIYPAMPQSQPVTARQSGVVRAGQVQPQSNTQVGLGGVFDAGPPPGFDIVGRGILPGIHFETIVTTQE